MDYLQHWGLEGMKWGVRRYQYPDGRFTPEGYERYFGSKVQKIKDYSNLSNEKKIKADEWKNKMMMDSKAFLFRDIRVDFDNWRFKVNAKKEDKYTIKALKEMNKYLNNIKKIKVEDKEAKKYINLAKEYEKEMNIYTDKLIANQNRYEKVYNYLNKRKNNNTVI